MRRRKLAWRRKIDTSNPGRVGSAEGGAGIPMTTAPVFIA